MRTERRRMLWLCSTPPPHISGLVLVFLQSKTTLCRRLLVGGRLAQGGDGGWTGIDRFC